VSDQDPSTPAKVDPARVPGLLDQYRQQRRAWLAQADELVRMREEVRQAAEREAIEIVTAARRDVRRIIVEARRELLVLTAQLHAAVEATDAPALESPPFTALLADPDARSRVESASHDTDITRDVVHEARKGVRSVLDEARAEIEALSAEAPDVFGRSAHGTSAGGTTAFADDDHDDDDGQAGSTGDGGGRAHDSVNVAANRPHGEEGPVHELTLDESLAALDFQTRDMPIPTLARILGSEPLSETPRLSDLRTLLRESVDPVEPHEGVPGRSVLSPDVEPLATSPFAFDTTPKPDFFADRDAVEANDDDRAAGAAVEPEPPLFTPPSRLFGQDEARPQGRSARTWVGLFAATGALAVIGTIWWVLSRDSAPLSAAAPPVITDKSAATAPATTGAAATASPAVAANAPGTLALTIEARRPSWIRAQIDGKDDTGRIYQAGETRHIYGARTVSIRAGDAGAVFVGVDGGTARALGADGVAATKQFSAAVTPAAATANTPPISLSTATATAPSAAPPPAPVAETAAAPRAQTPPPAAPPAANAARPAAADAAVRDGVGGGRPDLVQAAQQWLDAYQRRDRESMTAMGTENVTISDERSVTERFPAWQGGVQRDLDEVALELTGDVAVFTARMTEHADAGGGQHVSRVSQFWQRRGARWYVTNVRIIGEARLNQIIR
jgi:ketosteroid isomerase-like protein